MPRGHGTVQRKILLLLLGGFTLSMTHSSVRYWRILKLIGKEWRNIDRDALWRSIRTLYTAKLVERRENSDGSVTLHLSDRGKKYALSYQLDEMKIKPMVRWDGKWRLVAFDIPEKRKKAREALRIRFRQIGLLEFQKSVFVHPYTCEDEIDFLIEFYEVRPYVRKILAHSIDNEMHLKQKFGLQ